MDIPGKNDDWKPMLESVFDQLKDSFLITEDATRPATYS